MLLSVRRLDFPRGFGLDNEKFISLFGLWFSLDFRSFGRLVLDDVVAGSLNYIRVSGFVALSSMG